MDDLVAWLTAQLDDDERAASDPNWWKRPHGPGCAIGADHAPECDCNYAGQVLREVEAKRRRLARHAPQVMSDPLATGGAVCSTCRLWTSEWPCSDICDDAAVYSDRPGYRSEWAQQ